VQASVRVPLRRRLPGGRGQREPRLGAHLRRTRGGSKHPLGSSDAEAEVGRLGQGQRHGLGQMGEQGRSRPVGPRTRSLRQGMSGDWAHVAAHLGSAPLTPHPPLGTPFSQKGPFRTDQGVGEGGGTSLGGSLWLNPNGTQRSSRGPYSGNGESEGVSGSSRGGFGRLVGVRNYTPRGEGGGRAGGVRGGRVLRRRLRAQHYCPRERCCKQYCNQQRWEEHPRLRPARGFSRRPPGTPPVHQGPSSSSRGGGGPQPRPPRQQHHHARAQSVDLAGLANLLDAPPLPMLLGTRGMSHWGRKGPPVRAPRE